MKSPYDIADFYNPITQGCLYTEYAFMATICKYVFSWQGHILSDLWPTVFLTRMFVNRKRIELIFIDIGHFPALFPFFRRNSPALLKHHV